MKTFAKLFAVIFAVVFLFASVPAFAGQKLEMVRLVPAGEIPCATYQIEWSFFSGVDRPSWMSFQIWAGKDSLMPAKNILADQLTGSLVIDRPDMQGKTDRFTIRPNLIIGGNKIVPWYTVLVHYPGIEFDHANVENGWLSIAVGSIESPYSVDDQGEPAIPATPTPEPIPTPEPTPSPPPPPPVINITAKVAGKTVTSATNITINEGQSLAVIASASAEIAGASIVLYATGHDFISQQPFRPGENFFSFEDILASSTAGIARTTIDSTTARFDLLTGGIASASREFIFTAQAGETTSQATLTVAVNNVSRPVEFLPVFAEVEGEIVSGEEIIIPEDKEARIFFRAHDNGGGEEISLALDDDDIVIPGNSEVNFSGLAAVEASPGSATYSLLIRPDLLAYDTWGASGASIVISASNNVDLIERKNLRLKISNTSQKPIGEITYQIQPSNKSYPVEPGATVRVEEGQIIAFKAKWRGAGILPVATGSLTQNPQLGGLMQTIKGKSEVEAEHIFKFSPILSAVSPDKKAELYGLKMAAWDTDRNYTAINFNVLIIDAGSPKPEPAPAEMPFMVISQGHGGTTASKLFAYQNERFNRLASFSMPENFARLINTSRDRGVKNALADITGNGTPENITSFGPGGLGSTFPSILMLWKLGEQGMEIVTSKAVFSSVAYNGRLRNPQGALNVCAGRFTDSFNTQIVAAQGLGGSNQIRIMELSSGKLKITGTFQGLTGAAAQGNSSGGTEVAAGDVDGDGLDELIVGQMNGQNSTTLFQVVNLRKENGAVTVSSRSQPIPAMPEELRGLGGVNLAVGDVNGDGEEEIVVGSAGLLAEANSFIRIFKDGFPITPPLQVFNSEINPGGGVDVACANLDNDPADEILVSTQENITLQGNGSVAILNPATVPSVAGFNIEFSNGSFAGKYSALPRFQAFSGNFVPESGGVNIDIY